MKQEQQKKRSFKSTLNMPKTSFPMKGNLVQNEPATLKRWDKAKLYDQIRQARKGSPRYVFHDGPPYANGSIHLGHLLNKVLKDFVVRSKTMAGYDVPYTPGWDCHGLPIEHKVMQQLGEKAKEMVAPQIRKRCQDYAKKFVKSQSIQMKRLLTLADYQDPYLTMNPKYEAAVLDVFASLVSEGIVYRALKPVHWSIENQTALADAELEYYDREDTSVFVHFEIQKPSETLEKLMQQKGLNQPTSLMIWTTTPWTLPANLAVAVNERYEYGLYQVDNKLVILATELAAKVLAQKEIQASEPVAICKGKDLVGTTYQHPFIDRISPVVAAEYVTLEDGTGLVHTAPGHGVEDYQTGLREKLEVYCPVLADGTFDQTVPTWLQGKSIWPANDLVIDQLTKTDHLFFAQKFTHSYPHDWRGKTPVIFRATKQWFIGVEMKTKSHAKTLRELALEATAHDVHFIPAWGRNRMRGMLESRPDWCISRQRSWGLPIPGFYDPQTEKTLLTAATVRAVASVIKTKGSDVWFHATPAELLADYQSQNDPDAPTWIHEAGAIDRLEKSSDIFDVWFESGSSWNAVMRERGHAKPDDAKGVADLYLEGSDQHRGWFQLSLLPALGVLGKAPFENVLTHGFMVDKNGHKMSKSLGNTLDVDVLFKEFGADVCRWWVSTLNADNDIKVDHEFFRLAGEEYRKIRNTIRFLLSNLYDFDAERDKKRFELEDKASIDAWATSELIKLVDQVKQAYENLNFRLASELLFHFCNETLSAIYLVAVKDRLYCDKPDSDRRRRTQFTIARIVSSLIRLIAPILPHTADEAWAVLRQDKESCVHLQLFKDVASMREIPVSQAWPDVMKLRDTWLKKIEDFRQSHDVDNPMDVGLIFYQSPKGIDLTQFEANDLADLCGISRVTFELGKEVGDMSMQVVDLRQDPRCERSWKRDGTVETYCDAEGESVQLSLRDAQALGLA